MREEDVMSNYVRFSGWISFLTEQMTKNRTSSRCLYAYVITLKWKAMRFIESDPVLYSISKSFEAGNCIMLKVFSVHAIERLMQILISLIPKNVLFSFFMIFFYFYYYYLHYLSAQPSFISIFKHLWEIPMIQCYKRSDTWSKKKSSTFNIIILYGKKWILRRFYWVTFFK